MPKHVERAYIRGKVERIAYCKLGIMSINFRRIDGFPTVLFVHLRRRDTLIAYLRVLADFETMRFPRYGL